MKFANNINERITQYLNDIEDYGDSDVYTESYTKLCEETLAGVKPLIVESLNPMIILENYRKKLLCFRLNWSDGYFSCNPLIGFKCRKTIEGEFIKNLVEGDKILSDHRKLCTQQQIQELSQ